MSSPHLFFGLPSGRVNNGFHLYTLFTILSSGIRYKWPNRLNLWAFTWFIIFSRLYYCIYIFLICWNVNDFNYRMTSNCPLYYSLTTQWGRLLCKMKRPRASRPGMRVRLSPATDSFICSVPTRLGMQQASCPVGNWSLSSTVRAALAVS